jgi:hypothetical protein
MSLRLFAVVALLAIGTPTMAENRATAGPAGPAVANPHGDLKTDCEACHTAKSWKILRKPILFRHATTGFPLEGRHASAECVACHKSLEFARVATSCNDCHHDVHEGRSGARCQDCHTSFSWTNRSAALARHSKTGFPLRGVHALVECARCHVGAGEASQAPVSRDCFPCHTAEYTSTQSPSHAAAGFSIRCEECHDPTQARWGGAGFNHALTGFPLTGAHRLTACVRCHASGSYAGTPRNCFACHQGDYAATTNPNHATLGYSTQCEACHSTVAWRPANVDHDRFYFRIYTGRHAGKWSGCATCHVNGANYAEFTCFACHEHSQAQADSQHQGRSGYVYDSNACYACHGRV